MKSFTGRGRRSSGQAETAEVDLTPIMCLFIILVPLLLLTAVFEKLSALRLSLPMASSFEATEEPREDPSGIIELRLLVQKGSLELNGTISHDKYGKEKETYEDIRHELPAVEGTYDLGGLQKLLKGLKQEHPRHEDIVFLVDDMVSYDVIVQAMDTCREEILLEGGKRKSRPLFPNISLSEAFSEEGNYEGIRKGTRAIDKKMGIR